MSLPTEVAAPVNCLIGAGAPMLHVFDTFGEILVRLTAPRAGPESVEPLGTIELVPEHAVRTMPVVTAAASCKAKRWFFIILKPSIVSARVELHGTDDVSFV